MRAAPSRAPQQYDPLGALGSRPLVLVLGSAAVLWVLLAALFGRDVPGSPLLSALTVLLVAAAVGIVVFASAPIRAPFPRGAFVAVVVLLVVAVTAADAAQWGPDTSVLNDAMPIVAAVVVLVMTPFRPWYDLLGGGLVLAAANAIAAMVLTASFPLGLPVPVIGVLAAAPTVVVTAMAVVFAATFVGLAERVQIHAGSYSVERAERDGIARTVQQDRVTILSRDVAPFLDGLRGGTVITDADRERARSIADGIRRVMVADADRTWLEQALVAEGAGNVDLDDPDGLVRSMDVNQRTVVRTFLRAVVGADTVDPAGVRIAVERGPAPHPGVRSTTGVRPPGIRSTGTRSTGQRVTGQRGSGQRETTPCVCVRTTARVADTDSGIHRTFDPYLAVLRVTFPDLEVEIRPSSLALRFSYDQH